MPIRYHTSLNRKILLILLFVGLGLFALLTGTVWKLFQSNVARLEIQDGGRELRRVENMLQQEVRRVDDIARDWAAGCYSGMFGGLSQDFFTPDYLRTSMANLRVHALWLIKPDGAALGGMNLNPYSRRPIQIDGFDMPKLQLPQTFLARGIASAGTSGFFWTNQGLMAISAYPAQREDRIGSPPGILVVGRLMGARELQYMQGVISSEFTIVNPVRNRLPPTEVHTILFADGNRTFMEADESALQGIASLRDIEDKATIQLRVRMPRTLYLEASTRWWQFAAGMFFVSLGTGVLILVLIRRVILRRLEFLDRSVAAVGLAGTASAIPDLGNDELGRLGCQINSMLERLRLSTDALTQSETRLRLFLEHFPGIAFQTDGGNRFRLLYGAVKTITGYPAEEFISGRRTWESIIHPDDLAAFAAQREERLARPGETIAITYRIRTAAGEIRTVAEQGRFVLASANLPGGEASMEGSVHDVTREKLLENQLHRAQHLESIGLLASGIAHDFNNVLQGILGHNLLARRAVSNAKWEKIPEHLDVIEKASSRGSGLVRDLLTFCRRQKVANEPLDLNAMVKEIHHFLSRTLPPSITFKMEITDNLPAIYANASQIQQILLNLCVNARDAMPEGGTLAIRTAAEPSGDAVRLEVRDTGTGIPAAALARIFEPFFTTKHAKGGSGLGLSMVYGAVQSANGRIACDSAVGKGTTFTIVFPAWKDAAKAASSQMEKPP